MALGFVFVFFNGGNIWRDSLSQAFLCTPHILIKTKIETKNQHRGDGGIKFPNNTNKGGKHHKPECGLF